MIAIHTSAPAAFCAQHTSTGKVFSTSDCMYGWGEPAGEGCIPHNLIYLEDFEEARRLARTLVASGFECVLTDADDWSEPCTSAAATLYRDLHEH